MKLDCWVSGYKVHSFPWIDGKTIYFNVSYYLPGQSLERPPAWEKTAYIKDNDAGRKMLRDFLHTLTEYAARLKIPTGGYAVLTF